MLLDAIKLRPQLQFAFIFAWRARIRDRVMVSDHIPGILFTGGHKATGSFIFETGGDQLIDRVITWLPCPFEEG